ncbi:MAG: hypothetical protein ACXAB4_01145 [Candidatus Hodarchaeales archaeon]
MAYNLLYQHSLRKSGKLKSGSATRWWMVTVRCKFLRVGGIQRPQVRVLTVAGRLAHELRKKRKNVTEVKHGQEER